VARRNPLIRKASKMTGPGTGGHKSAGILDDFAIRKVIHSKEGYYNKLEVNKLKVIDSFDFAIPFWIWDNASNPGFWMGESQTLLEVAEKLSIPGGYVYCYSQAEAGWKFVTFIGAAWFGNKTYEIQTGEMLYFEGQANQTVTIPWFPDASAWTLNKRANNLTAAGTVAALQISGNTGLFGGPINYAEFKSDGELNLHGTARVKKDLWVGANGIKAPGAKPATFVEDGLTGCWEFADQAVAGNQEQVSGTIKIPLDMDRSVEPTYNIGWHANGISPGNCKWQFEYLWVGANEDVTAAAQETLTIVSTASATSNGLVVAQVSGIDLPSSTDKAMFWRITRLSADPQDTIAAVTHMRGQFFQYTADKLGEAT